MTYDANFKQLLPDFLSGCEIRANEPVGKLPLEIDLVITCPSASRDGITIPVFNTHFASINIIEHKSSHVAPSKNDIAKLSGYVSLYCARNDISIDVIESTVAAWYIVASRPDFIDGLVAKEVISKSSTNGLYRLAISFLCPCYMLVIDELDRVEGNYPLLGFGSDGIMAETVVTMDDLHHRHALSPALENYLKSICYLNYKVLSTMTETKEIVANALKKNLKDIIDTVGVEAMKENLKEIIDMVGTEAVIDVIGAEKLEHMLAQRKTPARTKKKGKKN